MDRKAVGLPGQGTPALASHRTQRSLEQRALLLCGGIDWPPMSSNVEILLRATDSASSPIRSTNTEVKNLGQSVANLRFDEASGRWRTASGQFASASELAKAGLKQLDQAMEQTKQAASGLDRTTRQAGDGISGSLRRIGETAAGFLTAQAIPALLNMGQQAANVAIDYESALNMMQAVTGATAEQMALVGARAKELGADLTLPGTSAGDAALAMVELSKAGLTVEQSMAAAKGVLQLSAAGALSNAQAAEIAANALNAFGLEGGKAEQVANLLAAAANASSVEVYDVGDAFKMAAAVFSAFQGPAVGAEQAMTDLTTAIGVLGNMGIKGSDAGTSLKQMLLQLTGPSLAAKDAMRALFLATQDNVTADDLLTDAIRGTAKERGKALAAMEAMAGATVQAGDIAYDAAGKMRPMEEIIKLVAQATRTMTEEQRNAAITQIFGADASRAVVALMRSMSDEAKAAGRSFDDMQTAVTRQGAAADLAGARMKGLGGAIEGMKSQIETALLTMAEPSLPWLTGLVTQVSETIPTVVQRVMALGSGIGQALQSAQSAVAGPLAFIQQHWETFQAALTSAGIVAGLALVVGGLGSLGTAVTAAGGVMAFLAATFPLLAGAIGLVVSPVGALIAAAALLGAAWATNWGGIQDSVMLAWSAIGPALATLQVWLAGQIPAALALAQSAFTQIQPGLQTLANVLEMVVGGALRALALVITGDFNGAWALAQTTVQNAQAQLGPLVGQIAASIQTFIGQAGDFIRANLPGWRDAFLTWATDVAGQLPGWLAQAQTAIGGWLAAAGDYLRANLPIWTQQFAAWAQETAGQVGAWLGPIWTGFLGWLGETAANIRANLPGWRDAFLTWATDVAGQLPGWLAQAQTAIGGWLAAAGDYLRANLPIWTQQFTAWAQETSAQVSTWLGPIWAGFLAWLGETAANIRANLPQWVSAFQTWASEAAGQVGGWLEPIWAGFLAWLGTTAANIRAQLPVWADQFSQWASETAGQVGAWLEPIWASFQGWLSQQAANIRTELGAWGQAFTGWFAEKAAEAGTWAEGIWNGLVAWFQSIPGRIGTQLATWGQAIQGWFGQKASEIGTWADGVWTSWAAWFGSVPARITAQLQAWGQAFVTWFTQRATADAQYLTETWTKWQTWFQGIPSKISTQLQAWGQSFQTWFEQSKTAIGNHLSGWWSSMSSWFNTTRTNIGTSLGGWWTSLSTWWTSTAQRIPQWLAGWWTNIQTWFSQTQTNIGSAISQWPQTLGAAIQGVFASGAVTQAAADGGKQVVQQTISGVTSQRPDMLDRVTDTIIQVLAAVAVIAAATALKLGVRLVESVAEGVQSARELVQTAVEQVAQAVTGGLEQARAWLAGKLASAFDHVSNAIKGTISAIKKLADTARSIGDSIPAWMRPGSPMPLGVAFQHLAGVLPGAAAGLAQFGQAAAGIKLGDGASGGLGGLESLLGLAKGASDLGRQLVTVYGEAARQLSSRAVEAAQRLQGALQSIEGGVKSLIGTAEMLLGLQDGPIVAALNNQASMDWLVGIAVGLLGLGLRIVAAATPAAMTLNEKAAPALQNLSQSVQATQQIATGTLTMIKLFLDEAQGPALAVLGSLEDQTALVLMLTALVTLGRRLVDAAAQAAGVLQGETPAQLKAVADGIGSTNTIATTTFNLAKLLVETLQYDWGATDWERATDRLRSLAQSALAWTRTAAEAVIGIRDVDTSGLGPIKTGIELVLGATQTTFNLAKLLAEALRYDWNATNWSLATTLLRALMGAALAWTRVATEASVGIKDVDTSGLGPVKTAIEGVFGSAQTTFGLARLLAEALRYDWGATNWSAATGLLRGLVGAALDWTRVAAEASRGIQDVDTSGLGPIKTATETTLGVATATFGLVKLLVEALTFDWASVDPTAAVNRLLDLVLWAQSLVRTAAVAAKSILDVDTSGLTPIKAASENVLGLAQATFGSLKFLIESLKTNLSQINGTEVVHRLLDLVIWAQSFVRTAATAAGSLGEVDTSGLGPIKAAIENTLGVATSTGALLKTLVEALGLDWDGLQGQFWDIQRVMEKIMMWATQIVFVMGPAAGLIEGVDTEGLTPLRTALEGTLGVAQATLGALRLFLDAFAIDWASLSFGDITRLMESLMAWAIQIVFVMGPAAGLIEGVDTEGLAPLRAALENALGGALSTLELINTLNGLLLAGGLSLDVEAAKQLVHDLVTWGLALVTEFLAGANLFTGQVTPAATEFVKSLDQMRKVVEDYAKFQEKVGAVTVLDPQALVDLKQKVTNLISQAKELTTTFLTGANTFDGQPLVGSENLTKGIDQLQKTVSDTSSVLKALGEQDLSLPPDLESKTLAALETAKRLVTAFFMSANVTPATGSSVVSMVGQLISTLQSLGSLGDVATAAVTGMQQLMSQMETLATSGGTTAGVAFVSAFAAAITTYGGRIAEALRAVLAGVGVGQPGAPGGQGEGAQLAGQGGATAAATGPGAVSSGGASAAGGQTVYNAPQQMTIINFNQYVSNPNIAADAANQVILLKSQFGAGL